MNLEVKIKLFLYRHHSIFTLILQIAVTLGTFSSNIIQCTWLAVCCLSFSFRSGDLPSPQMAISKARLEEERSDLLVELWS